MAPDLRRFGPAWALALGIAVAGCSEASTRPDPEGEVLRLGRVHIMLEPSEDREAAEDAAEANDAQLEVTARFAFVRGLDEDFVRARVFMPVLAHEQVPVSECVVSDQLMVDAAEPASPELADMRELVLVDVGDLTVRIGDTDVDVPLALVPDLLPYISGVEYLQEAEMVPVAADATPNVTIQAGGSQTDDLPPFVAEGRVPAALGLEASEADLAEQLEGALVMRWREAGTEPSHKGLADGPNSLGLADGPNSLGLADGPKSLGLADGPKSLGLADGPKSLGPADGPNSLGLADGPITVRVQALIGGEPVGEEITCVIADRGEARIDIARLHTLGLPAQGDALRLTASRVVVTSFDAGEFTGSELVIERRDRLYVPLR